MYLGVDVGGSKTLVGVLDAEGVIRQSQRFPTPKKYQDFLTQLAETVDGFATKEFRAAGVGIPATHLDRTHGIGLQFGNLPWKNVEVRDDVSELFNCPVALENDAKLACLSEAMLRVDKPGVLYVTISTGIGYALCRDQKIVTAIGDGGGRLLLQAYKGKLVPWETFASGKAIVERYGRRAADIDDAETWRRIAHDLTGGLLELIAVGEPDVVVIGGSVGSQFGKLKPHLEAELRRHETPLLVIPPLEQAIRPEEAVLYGCYDLAKEVYGRNRQYSQR
jgi:predicted NBD/HSP70 family sugar kinase